MLISSVVQFEIRPLDRVPGLTITRTSACAVLLTLKGGARRGLEPRKTYERLGVHPRTLRTELGRLPWAS